MLPWVKYLRKRRMLCLIWSRSDEKSKYLMVGNYSACNKQSNRILNAMKNPVMFTTYSIFLYIASISR